MATPRDAKDPSAYPTWADLEERVSNFNVTLSIGGGLITLALSVLIGWTVLRIEEVANELASMREVDRELVFAELDIATRMGIVEGALPDDAAHRMRAVENRITELCRAQRVTIGVDVCALRPEVSELEKKIEQQLTSTQE